MRPATKRIAINRPAKENQEISEITIQWGFDRLVISDKDWVNRIADEAYEPVPDSICQNSSEFSGIQRGVRRRYQPPIAEVFLSEVVQLNLPAALRMDYGIRAPEQIIALRAAFLPYKPQATQLEVAIVFEGFRLSSRGQIRQAMYNCKVNEFAQVQVRSISNDWTARSFDGDSVPVIVTEDGSHFERFFHLRDQKLMCATGELIRRICNDKL